VSTTVRDAAIWQQLNTRLIPGQCQLTATIPSLMKATVNQNKFQFATGGHANKFSISANDQTMRTGISVGGQTSHANINLTMDNCPPLDPGERSRWLLLDREMGMGGELFNPWLNVRDRISKYINSCWTKQTIGTGRAYLHFKVWRGGRISNVELEGNYWGERSFADNAVQFIQSMNGNPAFYFPLGSQASDVHFQLWLENGNWQKLKPHDADENLSSAERNAKYERDKRRLRDLQIWLRDIGRAYSQSIIDNG
jgi:hypothetical protein